MLNPNNHNAHSIENLRKRLLDLSARNRLLSFNHPKYDASSRKRLSLIRIIDEIPDQLHEVLLSDEELKFKAIPEPTSEELIDAGYIQIDEQTQQEELIKEYPNSEEWAKILGYNASYELPKNISEVDKHNDMYIQTLLFPNYLENRLHKISSRANTHIEETGANILYMAFGFLEWYEAIDNTKKRLAPLLLLPVQINKKRLNRLTGTYDYTITYSGEDILSNISLREKLRIDFSLALPDLDENTKPEDYFKNVENLIANKPLWCVRRFVTIGFFNFRKLSMYLDLDQSRWPELKNHNIINLLCNSTDNEDQLDSSIKYPEEYNIDDLLYINQECPLVLDADSSQHSALIDAADGKNLNIEGPPGTGKSQTITNLIATSLYKNKSVLFVAEKLEALKVVKRNLDKVGLGDFCLMLHSYNTRKGKLIKDIEDRLIQQGNYNDASDIDAEIEKYEELKDKLKEYVELINQKWKKTQISVHSILMGCTRYRKNLKINPIAVHPSKYDGTTLIPKVQSILKESINQYSTVFNTIINQIENNENIFDHPWYGLNNIKLQVYEKEKVCDYIKLWQESLNDLKCIRESFVESINQDDFPNNLNNLKTFVNDISKIPLIDNDLIFAMPKLRNNNLSTFKKYLDYLLNNKELYQQIHRESNIKILDNNEFYILKHHISELKIILDKHVKIKEIDKIIDLIKMLEKDLESLRNKKDSVMTIIGHKYDNLFMLNENGINEIKIFIESIVDLKPSLWKQRNSSFDDEELDEFLPKLKEKISYLKKKKFVLSEVYNINTLPSIRDLYQIELYVTDGSIFRFLKKDWWYAKKQLKMMKSNHTVRYKNLKENISTLIQYCEKIRELEKDDRNYSLLGESYKNLDTDIDNIISLRLWYKKIRGIYGFKFGSKVDLGNTIIDMDYHNAQAIKSLENQGLLHEINNILHEINNLKTIFKNNKVLNNEQMPLIGNNCELEKIYTLLYDSKLFFEKFLISEELTLHQISQLSEKIFEYNDTKTFLMKNNMDENIFNGKLNLSDNINNYDERDFLKAKNIYEFANKIENDIQNELLKKLIYDNPQKEFLTKLHSFKNQFLNALIKNDNNYYAFEKFADIDSKSWLGETNNDINKIIARNQLALSSENLFGDWIDYIHAKNNLNNIGFKKLPILAEQGTIPQSKIENCYYLGLYDLLSREVISENPQLTYFKKLNIERIQKRFRESDKKLQLLNKQKIAWKIAQSNIPLGIRGPRVRDMTELYLLRHECSKKKRHIPIRKLVKRTAKALSAIKPCFMMGPMSVAQYIEPGSLDFDLIIMDEASQIKPEDAIGVIARGAQVVVVGDSNQLPPTIFFEKIGDDEDEDITPLEEQESILDATRSLFTTRRLRWHYRSMHENLIAFSNYSFYNGDLLIFPSPLNQSEEFGIKYHRVNGRFINKKNTEEARQIAQKAIEHLLKNQDESLGIVAMNIEQKDNIESVFEQLIKEGDQNLHKALSNNLKGEKPIFIKNLENVQGDERDVIFISLTYGPREQGGRVFQRFGPINNENGWRRLNVLFTRARKRMHVFTSMKSEDIIADNSSRGARTLRDFLQYIETGYLPYQMTQSNCDPESDFEYEVIESLQAKGFECVPQYGVAGYRIDIAVKDPGNPGRFLMGIECDGASYHSAKSVRDRDRLRHEILTRNYGWRIRHIWSTDWFQNPEGEIDQIATELKILKTQKTREDKSSKFVDEKVIKQENIYGQLPIFQVKGSDLREKLVKLDKNLIKKEMPNTPEKERILRPIILDMLIKKRPTTKEDFQAYIPYALRKDINREGKYLDLILDIIESSSK